MTKATVVGLLPVRNEHYFFEMRYSHRPLLVILARRQGSRRLDLGVRICIGDLVEHALVANVPAKVLEMTCSTRLSRRVTSTTGMVFERRFDLMKSYLGGDQLHTGETLIRSMLTIRLGRPSRTLVSQGNRGLHPSTYVHKYCSRLIHTSVSS